MTIMDLRQLYYFTTLAEALNFHRAAARLHISQPPLTVAIRKLEEELGAPLFLRGARGVSLTPAGEAALPPAREALAQAEQVRRAVRQGVVGERGRLAISFVGSAVGDLIPRLIPPFRARYPDVELVLGEGTSFDIQRAIDSGIVDVGIVRLPLQEHSDIVTEVIQRDHLVAALPSSHPLASHEKLQLNQLSDQPFVIHSPISVLHSIVKVACQQAGFLPRVAQTATQLQTVLSLVQSGLGVSLVPSRMVRFMPDGVILLPLADRIAIESGIAYAERPSAVVRNFVAMALAQTDTESLSENSK